MYLKSQLTWNLSIPADNFDAEGKMLQKAILLRLIDEFALQKSSKELGYFLALKTLDKIGEGIVRPHLGDTVFPVQFSCVTFKILLGEVLEGTVHKVMKHGVFVRCGPAEKIYVSHQKMGDYDYVPGDINPVFVRKNDNLKIEEGVKVRFKVLAERYDEVEKDFRALVSFDGEFLGPI